MVDFNQFIQAILFAIFAGLTAVLAALIGPTYDNLLVPELQPDALYPPLPPSGGGAGTFLSTAVAFSGFLVVHVVDPAVALVATGIGLLYLLRAVSSRLALRLVGLLPRLVVAVILANFTIPVSGAIFGLGRALYPVIAGFDGGTWQHWVNLAGPEESAFSWDNGVLAFVVSFALFALVVLLAAAVALRDALLAVLIVLLPLATLLWPIPVFAPLARRAWLLFIQLSFLPSVLVVPLELAVGSPSILLLLGYLVVAVSAPSLLNLTGAQLSQAGFPGGGSALLGGIQRGLAAASVAGGSYLRPLSIPSRARGAGTAAASLVRTSTSVAFPASIPTLAAEGIGWGARHLLHHLPQAARRIRSRHSFPAVRPADAGLGRDEGR